MASDRTRRIAEIVAHYCYSVMEQRGESKPDIYRRLGMCEWDELVEATLKADRDIAAEEAKTLSDAGKLQ